MRNWFSREHAKWRFNYRRLGFFSVKKSQEDRDEKNRSKLKILAKAADDDLARARTVWPFTPFIDTVSVDREKLTITKRHFFGVGEVVSFRLEDILNVTAEVSIFFGTIKIHSRFFDPDKPYRVKYMRRRDALLITQLVEGFIIAIQKDIDCTKLPRNELIELLNSLGRGNDPGLNI